MARETELGFKIKRVLSDNDQWKNIVKETEAFYDKLESNPVELEIGDVKHAVAQLQQVRSEYNKINNDASSNRGQIEFANTLCNVLDRAEDKFSDIGVMFKNVNDNTRKYVTGLSNITNHLADSNFGVKFLDVGAQFEALQSRAEELFNTLKMIGTDTYSDGDFSLWYGSFDKHDLRERIDVLRELQSVQEEMLNFDPDMRGRDFISGQNVSGLENFINRAQNSLELLKKSGLETTEELQRLREQFQSDMGWSGLWNDDEFQKAKENISDNSAYNQSIQNLKSYISEREDLLERLDSGYERKLFLDDEINDMSSTLRRELGEAQDQLKILEGLRGKDIGPDFSEVVTALNEIKDAIREIKDAFDPLTQAFANEESAIHAMVTSNVSQLEDLINKFKEVHIMVDELNRKDFSVTNVYNQKTTQSMLNSAQLDAYKEKAQETLNIIKILSDAVSKSQHAGKVLFSDGKATKYTELFTGLYGTKSQFNEVSFVEKIAGADTLSKIKKVVAGLDSYKSAVLEAAQAINIIEAGVIDTSFLDILDKIDEKIRAAGKIDIKDASSKSDASTSTDVGADNTLNQIKSLRDQVVDDFTAIRQLIEKTFDFSTLDPNLTSVQTITGQIYQQFVELQNKINALEIKLETPNMDGVAEAIKVIKQEGEAAEGATPKKDAFTAANKKVAESMKETGDAGKAAVDGVKAEVEAVEAAAKTFNNAGGLSTNAETIAAEYKSSGRVWDKLSRSTLESRSKLISDSFNKYIATAGINVSDINTTFLDKTYKTDDGSTDLYEVVKLVAKGTDVAGKVVTIIHEYNMASAALEKESTKFHDAINKFNLETAKSTAESQVKELQSQMGSFKIDISDLTTAQAGIIDEESFDVFSQQLKNAQQRLGELKSMLKSSRSLDPIVNSEGIMSNLDTVVKTYRESITKFSDVDGFGSLEQHLANIDTYLTKFNEAKSLGDGKAMAEAVAGANKEISNYNAQLNLVKARYQENNRIAKESESARKKALQDEKALLQEIAAEDRLSLDKDKQLALLSKQAAQWKKNGQLTDEARQKVDLMLDSLTKVTNSGELTTWKKQWSIVKDEILTTKYEIEAAAEEQKAVANERRASGAYWNKEFQNSLSSMIAPAKRPELEQLKSYMLQQAEVTKENIEEQYNAIMTIATNKNRALQKLMSANGANEKQYWQDEYSAWFGAWNNLDKDVVNNFFEDAGNQAVLGADKVDKFNDELERSKLLAAKLKDQEIIRATKESDQATKQALANEKALIAEEKALMKEIVSEEKFTLDRDKQFSLLSKQQAQWKKSGQLTEEVNSKINEMLDSLSKVTNSDELTIWKKQWSIVKDEVLATKYEIEAANKAQKATADERKTSGAYWDQEFKHSLSNIITPENRPELEQLKAYMLQQADATESAVKEQYDALFTIVKNKNHALQQLMSAKGPNEKQYWQDQYSAWYGAWNGLNQDVVSNFFENAGNQAVLGADKVDKFNDELERSKILAAKLKDNEYKAGQKAQDEANAENKNYGKSAFNSLEKFSVSMHASIRELQNSSAVSATLNNLVAQFDEAYTKIEAMRKQFDEDPASVTPEIKTQFQDSVHHAEGLRQKIAEIFKESQKLQKFGKPFEVDAQDVSQLKDLKGAMIEFANRTLEGEVVINGFNEEGTEMYVTLNQGAGAVKNITVALDKASGHLKAFTTGTSQATNEWEDFKTKAVAGAKNIIGMYVGFQEGVQAVRSGLNYVKEIDLAMTELKKVTDETDASYKQFLKDAGSTAAVIGSTISDFTEATATFARLGYSLEESSNMAETAIIYKNVADGLDSVEESSQSIISTMMAFGIEANDTMSIIDKFNAVGNNFAITSAGIGEALQRSASALFAAGNTIDEAIALITAANSVIQNPEQVGTALKTLSLRLRGAKTELEEAGEDVEGMAENTSELQEKLKALTHGKVDIMLDNDTFKSTTQILREMSEAWEDMTDIERASALELMGGKRQANILASVITNFETVEDVIETSMNSSGSAMAENAKWLDSIEGKTYQFTNALQTMWSNMIDSEGVKKFVDFGTDMIQLLDTSHGKIIALVSALQLMAKLKGFNITSLGKSLIDTIKNTTMAQQALQALSVTSPVGANMVLDAKQVDAYALAVSNLTAKKQAELLASIGLNQAQMTEIMTRNGVNDAVIKEAVSKVKVTNASRALQTATVQEVLTTNLSKDALQQKAVADFLAANGSKKLTAELLAQMVQQKILTAEQAVAVMANTKLAFSWKALGQSIKTAFLSNPIGWIMTIISAVVTLTATLDDAEDKIQETISKAKQLKSEYQSVTNTISDNISTLKGLESEFDELSACVDDYGNNISLSASDYERYKDIVESIIDMSPDVVEGYDAEGNAIVRKNELLERSIALMQQEQKLEAQRYTSTANWKTLAEGLQAEIADAPSKQQVQESFGNSLYDVFQENRNFWDIVGFGLGNDSGTQGASNFLMDIGVFDRDTVGDIARFGKNIPIVGAGADLVAEWILPTSYDDILSTRMFDIIEAMKKNEAKVVGEYMTQEQFDNLVSYMNDYHHADTIEQVIESYQSDYTDLLYSAAQTTDDFYMLDKQQQDWLRKYIEVAFPIPKSGDVESQLYKAKDEVLTFVDQFANDEELQSALEDAYRLSSGKGVDGKQLSMDEYTKERAKLYTKMMGKYGMSIAGVINDISNKDLISDAEQHIWNLLSSHGDLNLDQYLNDLKESLDVYEDRKAQLEAGKINGWDGNEQWIDKYNTIDGVQQEIDSLNKTINKYQNTYSDLKSDIESLTIDDMLYIYYNISAEPGSMTFEELSSTIRELKEQRGDNVKPVHIYSSLVEDSNSYNDILSKTSEIINDNIQVSKEYKDSLTALGISEEELAECFYKSKPLVVKNAKALNDLVKASRNNIAANAKMAKSYARLEYYDLVRQLNSTLQGMKKVDAATIDCVYSTLEQIDAVETAIYKYQLLEDTLLGVHNAFDEFNEAQEIDALNTYGDSYIEMAQAMYDALYKTGQVGTESFWSAVESLVPTEVYQHLTEDADRMKAIYDYYNSKILPSLKLDEDKLSLDYDAIEEFVKRGLQKNSKGESVFTGDVENFDLVDGMNLEKAAELLGMTKTQAYALFAELDKYNTAGNEHSFLSQLDNGLEGRIINITNTMEDLNKQKLALLEDNDDGKNNKAISDINTQLVTLDEQMHRLGLEAYNTWQEYTQNDAAIAALNDIKDKTALLTEEQATAFGLEWDEVKGQTIQQALDNLLTKQLALEEPTVLTAQLAIDSIDEQITGLQSLLKQAEDNPTILGVEADADEATIAEAKQKIEEQIQALQEDKIVLATTFGIELSEEEKASLQEELNAIEEFTINDKTFSVIAEGTSDTIKQLNDVRDAMKEIGSKSVTLTTTTYDRTIKQKWDPKTQTWVAEADGTAHVYGTAHAQGSWGAPRTETALVGELGPEMLVRNGRWTTVGDNGAEFTQVKKGDIIFNHKQTEDLLSKGYVTSRGKAYASGTAYSGLWNPTSPNTSQSNKPGNDFSDAGNRLFKAADSLSSAAGDIAGSASDASDEFREVFDWIEVRLEEINDDINLRSAQLENKVGHKAQNKTVDKIIDLNQKLYDNLIAGSNKYYAYAEKLLSKVPAEYREAAKDGTIAIETFVGEADEKTLEAIQEYREWVQKGDEAAQQAEETLTEISTLAKQAIDNVANDFENKTSIRDSNIEQLEAQNALLETDQGSESAAIYKEIIKQNNKNISTLEKQRDKMQAELNKRVESGEIKKYSQDWYDAVNDIAAVDTEIIELKTDTENYQDAMNELHWEHFDNLMGQYESISEEAENLIDILGNKDLVDDDGNWTDEGIASLGLYAQQMENAEMQAKQYEEEIKYLNKNWQKLGYTEEEYLEKLDELKDGQYGAIQAYHDSKDAIVDLNKERIDAIKNGIEEEIEAYEELISKKKEELDAEKDLHDFQKSVMDQQKDIADIQRQLAALSGDNSASARAKRAQLEAELAEAQAQLDETYYDRSISNQQDALDKELENFKEEKDKEMEALDEYLEDTEQVVSDSMSVVHANADGISKTIGKTANEYGLTIHDALTDPWKDGVGAVSEYTERFGDSVSATSDALNGLELDNLANQFDIELNGQDAVDTVRDNFERYQEAEYQEPKKEEPKEEKPKEDQEKAIKVGGKINAGSAKIYDYVGAPAENQYYSKDPIYTVLATDGDWVQVRHHSLKSGVTGWFKKGAVKAYAKGSKGVNADQWALIDELGDELILHAQNGRLSYLEKGSGVVPADLTANLMEWGKLDPSIMLDQNRPQVGVHPEIHNTQIQIDNSIAELIHIDHCDQSTLPDVEKIVNNALEKHTQRLNQSLRKYTR